MMAYYLELLFSQHISQIMRTINKRTTSCNCISDYNTNNFSLLWILITSRFRCWRSCCFSTPVGRIWNRNLRNSPSFALVVWNGSWGCDTSRLCDGSWKTWISCSEFEGIVSVCCVGQLATSDDANRWMETLLWANIVPENPDCTSTAVLKRLPLPTAIMCLETSLPSITRDWENCLVDSSYLSCRSISG